MVKGSLSSWALILYEENNKDAIKIAELIL
jgi:hypothetical protein